MTPNELEHYLHDHIPLIRAMQATVVEAGGEAVALQAPLAPNINQHATVFGGSASAVAILAAWSLLHIRLQQAGLPADVVIQRNSMEYLHPIRGTFTGRATFPLETADTWAQVTRMLTRKGKARIEITATLECEDQIVGRLAGVFAAFFDGNH